MERGNSERKMEGAFKRNFFFVLLVSVIIVKCVHGQTCQQSLPSQYDPISDLSTTRSNQSLFYLYPDFFNTTRCLGPAMNIRYQFCYLFARSLASPDEVFTVLVLSDEGLQYRIIHSFTEREDRDCDLVGNTCCKTVQIAETLNVQRDLALGFIIPEVTGDNINALYASGTSLSLGFESPVTTGLNTDVDSRIGKTRFSNRQLISNRRFSINFTAESPTGDVTTLGPGGSSDGSNDGSSGGQGTGGSNAGAVAGGVIVVLLVVGVATAIAVVLVVLFLHRRQQQKNVGTHSADGFDNQLYDRQMASGSINGKSTTLSPGDNRDSMPGDYAAIPEDEAHYEDMNGQPTYLTPVAASAPSLKSNASTMMWQSQQAQSLRSMGGVGQRSRGDTYPLPPPPPGAIDPYGDPFGSERGSVSSSHAGTGRYTLQSRQVMTLLSKGRSDSFQPADEPIYQDPAEDEAALYEQYQRMNVTYIQKDKISTTDVLGSGQFGVVFKGEWVIPARAGVEGGGKLDVAVKTLKDGAKEEDRVKFLQEAAIIGQFSHPNVVKLHGIVIGEQKMIVLELLLGGDLHHALIALNPTPGEDGQSANIDADLPHTLLSYCRQVASGMGYLALKSFIHRDLAARNILLSEDGVCKITDFGMSRDLANTNYYVSHGGKIPVRWTAPEAIHFHTYSTASDVWSFGCVMYEIWSLGHKPFDAYSNSDCIRLVDEGVRLPPPPGCPKTIYTLMIDCWHPDSSSRPDFVSVVQQLSLPDTKLLKWSEEDKATDPEAATLGAGLDKAVDLYKDLQERYITN